MRESPPISPAPPLPLWSILLTLFGVLLGAGIKMYSSPLLGLLLIVVSIGGFWWLIFPFLAQYTGLSQKVLLWLGWGGIVVAGSLLWVISSSTLPSTQAQVSSTNQSGGITAGRDVIVNNGPITIVNPPASQPHLEMGDVISLNREVANGYETIAKLKLVSPFPIGNLYVAVFGETIRGIELTLMREGAVLGGRTGVRDGYAFTNLPNAYGDLQLTILSSKPLETANKPRLEFRLE